MGKLVQRLPPLHRAVAEGNCDRVARMLTRNADIHARSEQGFTPLHVAVEQGSDAMVHLLLSYGANVRMRDHRGFNPLHLAALEGRAVIAADLVLSGEGIADVPDNSGRTPLHLAAAGGFTDVVDALLSHGASVKAQDHSGRTPLHDAAAHDHLEAAVILITHGANINAPDHAHRTPLHVAAVQDCRELVALLLSKQAAVDCRDNCGRTALHEAAMKGCVAVASELLRNGADIMATDQLGHTPLYLAVVHHHQEMAEYFKKRFPSAAFEQEAALQLMKDRPAAHSETEFMRLAARVQEQARMLEEMLAAFPDQIYLVNVRGNFTYVNPSVARFWGKQAADLLGQSWQALDLPADCIAALADHCRDVSTRGVSMQSELIWPAPAGPRCFGCNIFPIHRADGAISMVVCVAQDITLRKQAETAINDANALLEARVAERTAELSTLTARLQAELAERERIEAALHASEERFRLLAQAAFEGIVISEQGVIREANDQFARMLGYPLHELAGKSVLELVVPDDREMVKYYIVSSHESPYTCRALRKDGAIVPIEVHGKMISCGDRLFRVTAIHPLND
jgi:PAS domain S-box-containing protein